MIVLHILLGILKILGIVLLILLGLVLVILLLILFCPVRYQAQVEKEGKVFGGKIGVSWLSHLISVKVWYESGEAKQGYSIRIFGIPVIKVLEFMEKRRKKKTQKQKNKKKTEVKSAESKTEETKEIPEGKAVWEAVNEKEVPELAGKSLYGKIAAVIRAILGIPGKIVHALENFRLTVERICAKIEQVKEFLESDHFIRGRSLVLQLLRDMFLHIKPRKIKGYLKIGTEDPCTTGEILAAAGIFFPLYGENLTIEPYFDQNILEGNLFIRGRVCGVFFAVLALRLFRDSDIRYMVKKFKQR